MEVHAKREKGRETGWRSTRNRLHLGGGMGRLVGNKVGAERGGSSVLFVRRQADIGGKESGWNGWYETGGLLGRGIKRQGGLRSLSRVVASPAPMSSCKNDDDEWGEKTAAGALLPACNKPHAHIIIHNGTKPSF